MRDCCPSPKVQIPYPDILACSELADTVRDHQPEPKHYKYLILTFIIVLHYV